MYLYNVGLPCLITCAAVIFSPSLTKLYCLNNAYVFIYLFEYFCFCFSLFSLWPRPCMSSRVSLGLTSHISSRAPLNLVLYVQLPPLFHTFAGTFFFHTWTWILLYCSDWTLFRYNRLKFISWPFGGRGNWTALTPPPLSPHSGLRTALEDTSLKIKPWEPRWWIETKLCLVFGPPRIISWTPKKIISWTPQKSFCGPQKPFRSPQVKNHCCGTQIGQ